MADAAQPRDRRAIGCLTVLGSPDRQATGSIHLLGANTYVGREPAEPELVWIADPGLAVRHCRIVRSADGYALEDLCLTPRSRVEAKPVRRRTLAPGELIRCGDTLLLFTHLDLAAVRWAQPTLTGLVGGSPAYVRALMALHEAAAPSEPVLLVGEAGAGRQRLAWELHALRGRGPGMLIYDCGRAPTESHSADLFGSGAGSAPMTGLAAAAVGGTLYIEDVSHLAAAAHRPLRAWTRRMARHGARSRRGALVGSATPGDLELRGSPANFAEWRVVDVPPLRARRSDILPLARAWLRRDRGGPGRGRPPELSCDLEEALVLFPWPGNLDALHEMLRRLVLVSAGAPCLDGRMGDLVGLGRRLQQEHVAQAPRLLPWGEALPPVAPQGQAPSDADLRVLWDVLGGSVRRVAAYLGRDRSLVHRWLKSAGCPPHRPAIRR